MAVQLFKENSSFNVENYHFLIDSVDELDDIELIYKCHQGDKAELPDGTVYVRHSDNYSGDKWTVKSSSSNNGSGGSDLPTVTEEDNGNVLTVMNGEWGKSEASYVIKKSEKVIIPEQTVVTTLDQGFYGETLSQGIPSIENGESIIVTLDGIQYNINPIIISQSSDTYVILGEIDNTGVPDFSNYPFFINGIIDDTQCYILTETEGTHTIKITRSTEKIIPSNNFTTIINKIDNKNWLVNPTNIQYTEENSNQGEIIIPLTTQDIYNINNAVENNILSNSIAIINDIELPFSAESPCWITVIDEVEYILYPIQNEYSYDFGLIISNGTTYKYGDYIIGLYIPKTELPAVTNDDNDKVLTVVDGVWDKATLPAPESTYIRYTIFRNTTTGNIDEANYIRDKDGNLVSINTIINQLNAGVFIIFYGYNDNYFYYLSEQIGSEKIFVALADSTHTITVGREIVN